MTESRENLTAEYEAWLDVNPNVPKLSADEALFDLVTLWGADDAPNPTPPHIVAQFDWLHDFIDRWEIAARSRAKGVRQ
jgi:hypothetical protein